MYTVHCALMAFMKIHVHGLQYFYHRWWAPSEGCLVCFLTPGYAAMLASAPRDAGHVRIEELRRNPARIPIGISATKLKPLGLTLALPVSLQARDYLV
jgi:hypothetical protein